MRTNEQKENIKKHHSASKQILDFLDSDTVDRLLTHYHTSEKTEKNTGPKVVYVKEGEGVIDDLLVPLRKEFGNFKVRSCHFFDVSNPHVLHIDDSFEYPNSYKAFTLPLWVSNNDCNKIKLVTFDQYYYGGPVKFFKGDKFDNEVIFYNKHLYDYADVEHLSLTNIPVAVRKNLLTHIKESWLDGLSVADIFPWTIGSVIAFDSLRIHCSSDFKRHNIKSKIGLSIFTEI